MDHRSQPLKARDPNASFRADGSRLKPVPEDGLDSENDDVFHALVKLCGVRLGQKDILSMFQLALSHLYFGQKAILVCSNSSYLKMVSEVGRIVVKTMLVECVQGTPFDSTTRFPAPRVNFLEVTL